MMGDSVYYNLPKMNNRWIKNITTPYLSKTMSTDLKTNLSYSIQHFNTHNLKDKDKEQYIEKNTEKNIEKEWNKLNNLLIKMHIMNKQINLPNLLCKTDNVWNYLHYSTFSSNENIWSQEKLYHVLFLNPQSVYTQNSNTVNYIFSLFDLNDEQLVYLTLLSILLQSSKGIFVLKIKTPFTSLSLDLFFLLSSLYNKVIILPVDHNTKYLICKGFQSDYIKNHVTNLKNCLFSIRPYHVLFHHAYFPQSNEQQVQQTMVKITNQMRILMNSLPLYYISKMEEIQILLGHKLFHT